jgi:hypothetical protein
MDGREVPNSNIRARGLTQAMEGHCASLDVHDPRKRLACFQDSDRRSVPSTTTPRYFFLAFALLAGAAATAYVSP